MINKTLKFKEGIGITSIIIGFLRFFRGIDFIFESFVFFSDYYSITFKVISLAQTLIALIIAVFGIVLLYTDKGKLPHGPREKSREVTMGILILALSHALVEGIFFVAVPFYIIEYQGIGTMIGALSATVSIIVLCGLGLRGFDTTSQNISTNTQLDDGLKNHAPQYSQPDSKENTLDDEIARLKAQIEKVRLEKELNDLKGKN